MSKARVLIIDDEPDLVNVVKLRLESSGYDVLSANDGYSGLHIAHSEKPDVILLDIIMPEMDGFKVYDELKKSSRTWSIPVIILTAKDQTVDELFAYKKGIKFYLKKPYDPKELIKTIGRALKASQSEGLDKLSRKQILIIDENADVAEIIQSEVAAANFDVSISTSLNEGLKKAKQEKVDLIIMDGLTSRKDYHNNFFELRYEKFINDIPIIVTAPENEIESLTNELELGKITAWVKKPIAHKELLEKINELIKE